MNEFILDCMGLPCPQPVLKCKNTLEAQGPESLVVTVDNAAAAENVARFLGSQGYETATETTADGFRIKGRVDEVHCEECKIMTESEIAAATESAPQPQGNGTVVFITSDTLGSGDDSLGAKLMQNFLLTLPELGANLWRIILVNSAVRLSTSGHSGLTPLKNLAEAGVSILVCGTCLEHFGLLEAKQVGETTNMLDVVTSLDTADKVIKV